MGELYLFFTAVKEQWRRILTGSLTLALLGLVQGIGKIRVTGYLYWGVLCIVKDSTDLETGPRAKHSTGGRRYPR
jgi:hypothetical protein